MFFDIKDNSPGSCEIIVQNIVSYMNCMHFKIKLLAINCVFWIRMEMELSSIPFRGSSKKCTYLWCKIWSVTLWYISLDGMCIPFDFNLIVSFNFCFTINCCVTNKIWIISLVIIIFIRNFLHFISCKFWCAFWI